MYLCYDDIFRECRKADYAIEKSCLIRVESAAKNELERIVKGKQLLTSPLVTVRFAKDQLFVDEELPSTSPRAGAHVFLDEPSKIYKVVA